jgi:ABC-type lipoprotein release transport system permease subunit
METYSLIRQGIKAGCSDWKRSKWLMAGIMLGIAFYIAISSIGASYTELVRLPFSRIESDLLIQLGTKGRSQGTDKNSSIKLPFSNQAIESNTVQSIAALRGIKKLDPAIMLWHQEKTKFLTITGVNPHAIESGPAKVLQWISKGRSLQNSGETVVESHYAKFNKLKPGNTISFGEREFQIVGISKIKEGASLAAANFYILLDDARALAGMDEGAVNLLSASLQSGTDKDLIKKEIIGLLSGSIVSSTDSIGEMMQGFAKISAAAARLLSIIALIFTLLFSCWLIIGRQEEQRWQVGLMQTMGWQNKDILLRTATEILTISLIAAIAGMALGYLFSIGIGSMEVSLTLPWNLAPNPEGMHQVQGGKSIPVPLPVVIQPFVFASGVAATCLTAVSTGVWCSSRLSGLGIRETLFGE